MKLVRFHRVSTGTSALPNARITEFIRAASKQHAKRRNAFRRRFEQLVRAAYLALWYDGLSLALWHDHSGLVWQKPAMALMVL